MTNLISKAIIMLNGETLNALLLKSGAMMERLSKTVANFNVAESRGSKCSSDFCKGANPTHEGSTPFVAR